MSKPNVTDCPSLMPLFLQVRRRDPGLAVESRGSEGALQPVLAAHTGILSFTGP